MQARTTYAARTASSPNSITPTSIPAIRNPRSGSRRSPQRTTCCRIPTSGASSIAARSTRRDRKGRHAPGIANTPERQARPQVLSSRTRCGDLEPGRSRRHLRVDVRGRPPPRSPRPRPALCAERRLPRRRQRSDRPPLVAGWPNARCEDPARDDRRPDAATARAGRWRPKRRGRWRRADRDQGRQAPRSSTEAATTSSLSFRWTLSEAVLGAQIDIPTPSGLVRMRVPAGSDSGKRLRLPRSRRAAPRRVAGGRPPRDAPRRDRLTGRGAAGISSGTGSRPTQSTRGKRWRWSDDRSRALAPRCSRS